ncbi:MAG: hypothetical protein WC708_21690 [Lentisphaeria bacterium]
MAGLWLAAVLALAPVLAHAAPPAAGERKNGVTEERKDGRTEERKNGKMEEPAGTDPLQTALAQTVAVLEREGLVSAGDENARLQLLQGLLGGIGCGARYEPAGAGRPVNQPDPWDLGGLVLLERQFAYVPVNRPGPGVAEALAKAWDAAVHAPAGAPAGLILDLRFASGGDLPAAQALARTVGGIAVPRVLLVGPETTGAAEIAAMLVAAGPGGATLVGRATRGCIASLEPVSLPNGDRLWLPRAVKAVDGRALPAGPVAPDVVCSDASTRDSAAGLTAERFLAFPGRDLPLRRAVDLLKTASVLKEKHF